MQRFGQVIGVKPERYQEYVAAHAAVWPGVLARIRDSNIRNYSIYSFGDRLFAYFEYVGDDFAGGHGADGRGPGDPALVGRHDAHAAAGRRPRRG